MYYTGQKWHKYGTRHEVSYLIHYEILLQNVTDITKCDCCFIIKGKRSSLQNASGFYYQNATVLLQNVAIVTNFYTPAFQTTRSCA